MAKALNRDDGREMPSAYDPQEVHEAAVQLSDFMRANGEAVIQAWSTTTRGVLSFQEHLTRFVGMRMQKDLDMAQAIAGCGGFEQIVDQQMAFGRTMVEDYMRSGEELLQSAIDIVRDGAHPLEARAEAAPQEARAAFASAS